MAVHSGLERLTLVFLESIRRHSHDGDVRFPVVRQRADLPCGDVSVHARHLDVHEHQIVGALGRCAYGVDRLDAVFGAVDAHASLFQDRCCYLPVELVVLNKQDALATVVVFRRFHRGKRLRRGTNGTREHFPQLGHEDRFGHKSRHASFPRFLLVVRPVIGCQHDNGHILADHLADAADRLDAVHVGHKVVHDVDLVLVLQLGGILRAEDRLLARSRPIRAHVDVAQHLANAAAGVDVVVDDQRTRAFELWDRLGFRRLIRKLHVQRYSERGSLPLLAFRGDAAAHHPHDVLGDGHAKASALDAADRGRAFPGKGVEYVLDEFLGHADAGVFDGEHVGRVALARTRLLDEVDDDIPANRRELDGVAGDVEQDLVQTQLVDDDVLVPHILGVDEEVLLLRVDKALDHAAQVMQKVRHVHRLLVELHAAAFDAAHIQDVVDQAQQVRAGSADLRQVILHQLRVVYVRLRQRREADDGVHGRADVVGHVVQERRFRAAGLLGCGKGKRQALLLLLLFAQGFLELRVHLVLLVDAHDKAIGTDGRSVGPAAEVRSVAEPMVDSLPVTDAVFDVVARLPRKVVLRLLVLLVHERQVVRMDLAGPAFPGVGNLHHAFIAHCLPEGIGPGALRHVAVLVVIDAPQAGGHGGMQDVGGVVVHVQLLFVPDALIGKHPEGKVLFLFARGVRGDLQAYQRAVRFAVGQLDFPPRPKLVVELLVIKRTPQGRAVFFQHKLIDVGLEGL